MNPLLRQSPHARPGAALRAAVRPELFLECVHCGLCTSACPTYTELGDENAGPRGRIYLMRMITAGTLAPGAAARRHLELCLDCRACETACPSGVHYGQIIEPFRLAMEEEKHQGIAGWDWFRELVLFRLFPYAGRIRLAMAPVRIAQRLGLYDLAERIGFFKLLPGRLGQMATLVNRWRRDRSSRSRRRSAGAPAWPSSWLRGDAMPPHHGATLRVLQQNGCDILIPDGQGYGRSTATPAQSCRRQRGRLRPGRHRRGDVNHAGCARCSRSTAHWAR